MPLYMHSMNLFQLVKQAIQNHQQLQEQTVILLPMEVHQDMTEKIILIFMVAVNLMVLQELEVTVKHTMELLIMQLNKMRIII